MAKWYENENIDDDIVISSRVRLARNLKKFNFPQKLTEKDAQLVINEVKNSIINDRSFIGSEFEFINIDDKSDIDKYSMLENHIISPDAIQKKGVAVMVNKDSSLSILINEEDHIRIQSIFSGYNIEKAWELADKIDSLIEESVEYAYDEKYGYITSCITNIGTGLRASFMIHIPMLERYGRIKEISQSISKFGMTIRGIYGEGSEPLGSIYQISNQITIGKTENDIIESLKNITTQVVNMEKEIRNDLIQNHKYDFENMVYRSYGILKYCKKISSDEAMKLLSDIRLGYMTGLINQNKTKTNIYNIMMSIQSGNLQKMIGEKCNEQQRDIQRAKFINDMIG